MLKTGSYKRTNKRSRIVRTLLPVVPMWFAITIASFLATRCVTDGNTNAIADGFMRSANPPDFYEVQATIRHSLGLDQPIHIHYLRWMGLMKQEDG
jgi:ABC-type dipeptide/oligopeptide/nickel transport system permease component